MKEIVSKVILVAGGASLACLIIFLWKGNMRYDPYLEDKTQTKSKRIVQNSSSARYAGRKARSAKNPRESTADQILSWHQRAERTLSERDNLKRRSLIGDLVREWATQDPDSCVEWASGLQNIGDRGSVLGAVTWVLLQGSVQERAKAFDLIDSIENGVMKDGVIVVSFSLALEDSPRRALELVKDLSGSGARQSAAYDLAKSSYGRTSSDELMNDLEVGDFRNLFASEIVKVMATEDPEEALDWLNSHNDFDGARNAYLSIARSLSGIDPLKGLAVCESISDPGLKTDMIRQIGSDWAREQPEAAGQWLLGSLAKGGLGENKELASAIVGGWVQWNHEAPFREIAKLPEGPAKKVIMEEALQTLAFFDGARAAQVLWNDTTFEADERVNLADSISANWLHKNSIEASKWILSLPAGPERDVSIRNVINEVVEKDGDMEMAFEWANEINDMKLRKIVIEDMDNKERHVH
jgi:hypothetical protein